MPKMIVSIDGVVIREVQVTKDRTSVGRRPYNDVVIDNLAVSGEHAVLQMSGNEVYLEDLNSTNGTFVNGKAVKKQLLNDSDMVEIGKYKIKYVNEASSAGAVDKAIMSLSSHPAELSANGSGEPAAAMPPAGEVGSSGAAAIKVLSGAAAGREVALVKVVTTIGKPGVAVAAITKRPHGFVVVHVEGSNKPTLNGIKIDAEPVLLSHGDVLELAGTKMQFVQQ
jgi:pSer/pThr/pTyr-binding forkhead associated (FHA) protein